MVGKPFTTRVRLCSFAASYWQAFDGEFAARGQDPLDLPFDRFLNAVYAFVVRERRGGALSEVSLDDAIRWLDAELAKPIPGYARESRQDADDELALFRRAQGA